MIARKSVIYDTSRSRGKWGDNLKMTQQKQHRKVSTVKDLVIILKMIGDRLVKKQQIRT